MKTQITILCTGYSIAADLYLYNDSKDFLLTVVGLNSSKARNVDFVSEVSEKSNLNALVIDLSGHGESPFQLDEISPAQHMMELVHVFDWLTENYPEAKINVMGTSYGGFLVAYLAQYRSFSKLVLRTPALYRPEDFFTNHSDIDKTITSTVYRKSSSEIATNPIFTGKKIFTGPTFVVVHELDESVPTETTNRYIDSFAADIFKAEGFKHPFSDPSNPQDKIQAYKEAVYSWLSNLDSTPNLST